MDSAAKTFTPTPAWKIETRSISTRYPRGASIISASTKPGMSSFAPTAKIEHEIDPIEVVEGLKARDLTAPVVVRFSDILRHRRKRLHGAFTQAIAENDYQNRYCAVFPIKVNQQRLVVEEVYRYGKEFGFGLEAGSKPELLAVMALTEDASERISSAMASRMTSYIEAVILATKLGRTIIPVIENFEELALVLKHAEKYQVRPCIGVRVKAPPAKARDAGVIPPARNPSSACSSAKSFELARVLREPHQMLDCLELVHCHPGSPLQDIRRVKDAINELAHVYAELKLRAPD